MSSLEKLLRANAGAGERPAADCPGDTTLAGYVDGGLDETAHATFERHLVDCPECLRSVGFLSRAKEQTLVRPSRDLLRRAARLERHTAGQERHGHRRWVAVAAGVVLVTSVSLWLSRDRDLLEPGTSVRSAESDRTEVTLLSPTEGTVMPATGMTLRWRPAPASLYYEVKVVDADGGIVWQARLEQTEVVVPSEAELATGETYYALVDALLADGKRLSSGHVGFEVSRE